MRNSVLYAALAGLIIVPIVIINFIVGPAVKQKENPAALSPQMVSAELGDKDKAYALARAYRNGKGVTADISKAASWYRIAAQQGHHDAATELGLLICAGKEPSREPGEAAYLLRFADDPAGNACLCRMRMQGDGVPRNDAVAFDACSKSAAAGNAEGLRLLGSLYMAGRGTPLDIGASGSYYAKASAAGDVEARDMTAHQKSLCADKTGADSVKACVFTAGAGDTGAQFRTGDAYYMGQGLPKDHAAAATWYRKAAEGGVAAAQISLAGMLANGDGIRADAPEAYAWYFVAAHNKGSAQQVKRIVHDMGNTEANLSDRDRERASKLATEYLSKYGAK